MKRYVVMHDYSEGWKIVVECDSVFKAVEAREADLAIAGGRCEIFEWAGAFQRYRDAEFERCHIERTKPAAGAQAAT